MDASVAAIRWISPVRRLSLMRNFALLFLVECRRPAIQDGSMEAQDIHRS
jgi:hypothetical protein